MAGLGTTMRTLDLDDWAEAFAITPDGSHVALGGQATTVAVYAVAGDDPARLPVSGSVNSLAFRPDGAAVAVADFEHVLLYPTAGGAPLWPPVTVLAGESVNAVAFTPSGAMLLAATDSTLALLDPATGKTLHAPITVERPLIARFDISLDGTRVVVALDHNHGGDHVDEGSARVIALATGTEITRAHPAQQDDRAVGAAVFSGDGDFVLCGRDDTTLLADAATGAEQWRIAMGAHDMAADPTGKWLIVGLSEGMAQAYDTDGDKKAQTTHDGAVTHVAVSPNGRWFASAGIDNVVRVHNIESDADRFHRDDLGEVKAMAFGPEGRFLALAIDQGVVLLDNTSPT